MTNQRTALPTYVISMDHVRYDRTRKHMQQAGIAAVHFNGVDGEAARWSDVSLTPMANVICPSSTIGCGLAHIKLAQLVFESGVDVALVVEDDVFVLDPARLRSEINNTLTTTPSGWDFILLFCMGACTEGGPLAGSTAAYLLSRSGSDKLRKMRLMYHIDLQRNSANFRTVIGPTLFDTYDAKSVLIGNQGIDFWLGQPVARLGSLTINVCSGLCAATGILVCAALAPVPRAVKLNFVIGCVTLMIAFVMYVTREAQHYKCTTMTHYFGLLLPVLLIGSQALVHNSVARYTMVFLSFVMLWFHLVHHASA